MERQAEVQENTKTHHHLLLWKDDNVEYFFKTSKRYILHLIVEVWVPQNIPSKEKEGARASPFPSAYTFAEYKLIYLYTNLDPSWICVKLTKLGVSIHVTSWVWISALLLYNIKFTIREIE